MSKVYDGPQKLNVATVQLDANLHVDAVNEYIHPFDEKSEHEKNNGIYQDGGITELYETGINDALGVGGAFRYETSTGRLLTIGTVSNAGKIFVDGTYLGKLHPASSAFVVFNKAAIPPRYTDVATSSTAGRLLGIYIKDTQYLYLDEIDATTFLVTQTALLKDMGTGFYHAVIARAHTLTFSSVQSTSGAFASGPTSSIYVRNGAQNTVSAISVSGAPGSWDNMVAYYNATTALVALPGATPGIFYNTAPGNYAAWSRAQLTATDGISMMNRVPMGTTDTLALGVSTASKTIPNFLIAVTNAGVLSTASAANDLFPNIVNFQMEAGVVTPLGSSGVYSTSGANPYGQFNTKYSYQNNPAGTKPVGIPDLMAPTTSGYLAIRSFGGYLKSSGNTSSISILTFGGSVSDSLYDGVMINDFGGGGYYSDIRSGNCYNTTAINGLFYPPDLRNVSTYTEILYKLNSGQFVLTTVRGIGAADSTQYVKATEIMPGVVMINEINSRNAIIDTNTGTLYDNLSGRLMSFFTNFTDTTNSKAYFQKSNKYSNALDPGLCYCDTTNLTAMAAGCYWLSDYAMFNVNGAYQGSLYPATAAATSLSTYQDARYATSTYSQLQTVPLTTDSVIQSVGAITPVSSVVTSQNYAGYQLANLLSVRMTAFFMLYGQYYSFDGDTIYSISLSGGSTGTINGVPQPVASAAGLRYLCASPTAAFFVSDYDNAIYAYDGGRNVIRGQGFSNKPKIVSGAYNVREDALVLLTTGSIITIRYGISTENTIPTASYSALTLNSSDAGVFFMDNSASPTITGVVRTYSPTNISLTGTFANGSATVTGISDVSLLKAGMYILPPTGSAKTISSVDSSSQITMSSTYSGSNVTGTWYANPYGPQTIIPLNWLSAYFGMRDNQKMKVYKITSYMYFASGTPSALTLTYNWQTQDQDGTTTATITPTANAHGYARFDYFPSVQSVTAAQFGITSADTSQKIVLLENLFYYQPDADAKLPATNQAS